MRKEVEEFGARHPTRPIVTISIGGTLQNAPLASRARESPASMTRSWLDEAEAAAESGIASDEVVTP